MMTRILLHGGNADNGSERNARFFTDILTGFNKSEVRILCIYFARPEGRWEDSFATDESSFKARAIELGKDVDLILATYDIEKFLDEFEKADVIFINGGYKGHLRSALAGIGVNKVREMIRGKTLVGISAGANMLSKYYYSLASGGIREGIGLLDIKLLTHANSDAATQYIALLKSYKENLPLVTIVEEEYVEITNL